MAGGAAAQGIQQTKGSFEDKFRQLDEILPSPNVYRNAAGEPGHQYYPRRITPSRVETYKFKRGFSFARRDIMQDSTTALKTDDEAEVDD